MLPGIPLRHSAQWIWELASRVGEPMAACCLFRPGSAGGKGCQQGRDALGRYRFAPQKPLGEAYAQAPEF